MTSRPPSRRGRTFGSGPVAVSRRGLLAGAALVAAALAGCSSGGSSPSGTSAQGQGQLPDYLRRVATGAVHQTLDASAASPAVASQGDPVRVRLTSGSVLARVTGPALGASTGRGQSLRTACTWTVELSQATGAVPVDVGRFVVSDTGANAYHPVLPPGAAPPPARVPPGATLRFQLQTVMPNGEALLRWAPDSDSILASWDFAVEKD